MKTFIALGVSLFTLLTLCTGCQFSSTAENDIVNTIERAYSVKPGGTLTVVSEFGAIDVQTAARDSVAMVITKEAKFKLDPTVQEALADFEVAFEHQGPDVRVEGTFKRGREHWQKKLNRLKIRFQVTVPQQSNVDLETSSGSIAVADLGGTVRARTSGGSLRFGNIEGTVWGTHLGRQHQTHFVWSRCRTQNVRRQYRGRRCCRRSQSTNLWRKPPFWRNSGPHLGQNLGRQHQTQGVPSGCQSANLGRQYHA